MDYPRFIPYGTSEIEVLLPLQLSLDNAGVSWSTRCEPDISTNAPTFSTNYTSPSLTYVTDGVRIVNNVKHVVVKVFTLNHQGLSLEGQISLKS
jgi:hypothetical protein